MRLKVVYINYGGVDMDCLLLSQTKNGWSKVRLFFSGKVINLRTKDVREKPTVRYL